jgi:polygalacturonase
LIQLYAVGSAADGSAATPLIGATLTTSDGSGNGANSNANAGNANNTLPAGSFTITGDYNCPSGGTEVYLVGTGGNSGSGTNNNLALMAALGPCGSLSSSTYIFMDELTTVGSIAALANYTSSYSAIGSSSADASALQTAFSMVNEYIDTTLGIVPGPTLPTSTYASSIEIQTLGDVLSGCINSAGGTAGDGSSCGHLFTDTTPSGAPAPTDTIGATLNIVNNPTLNVCAIYSLVPATPPFQPTLSGCPSNWNLPISAVTIAVTGPANVLFSQTGQYSAVVTGAGQTVNWMVNSVIGGSTAEGTISTGGLYTAPASAPATPVTIGAQSTAVTSATGSLSVTISATAVTYATGDSRTVTQPTNPAVCQTLSAQFTTSQRSSPPAAGSDDTSRIQAALTACHNTGQSVELAVSGSNNAFYSAELTVNGEGLVIDSGVTLEGNNSYSSQSELLKIEGTNAFLGGPGTVDGRGDIISGTPRLVQTSSANNFIAYNVTLQQAAHPNLYIEGGIGATVWGVTILTPATRANADGIDVDSISNATVINSTIEAGDDGVAVKTNSAAASNITVANNRLYGTHGISIGSQTYRGVSNILFSNNYLYGTDLVGNLSADPQGINIKTDPTCGGTVQQVTYQNTCLYGVKHLIVINANYGSCSGTAGTPQFQDIVINGVYSTSSVSGAYELFDGYSASYPINAYLANVNLDVVAQYSGSPDQYAGIALDNSNVTPSGTGITTSSFSTAGSVPTCSF